MKPLKTALNVINIIQVAGFELKYDLHALRDMILSVPGKEGAEVALQGYQGMAEQFIPQAQAMAGFLLAPYMEELRAFNLGSFEVHVYVPKIRACFKVNLDIPSLNTFINQTFLQ